MFPASSYDPDTLRLLSRVFDSAITACRADHGRR